jgi:peroxiredoxin
MALIQIGAPAPDIILEDTLEQPVRIADYLGKNVLLSWHPIAWTGVCTDQMRSLQVNRAQFDALNTVAFGVSVDPAACKKAWAAVLSIRDIKLLCDFWPHGKAAQMLGIWNEEDGMSLRANILIDAGGIVRWVKVYPSAQLPDIREVLEAIRGL